MGEFEELKKLILDYNPKAEIELIEKAYYFAKEAHKGQMRVSGKPYFTHPVEITKILIDLKVQSSTLCGALLHDVVEESNYTLNDLKKEFNSEIAMLVEGVTKIDKIHFKDKEVYNAENLRKILLATAKDIRIMLIKLADRLHNMRTLKYLRPDKQRRIATETFNIYAPIAHKLGIWSIKGELEDLCLRCLEPQIYQMLRNRISEKRGERENKTKDIINIIEKKLKKHGIDARVYGRAKYFYSIYKKMKQKNVDFSEIYDLIAIRIITKTIPDCYTALGVMHELWKPIPKKFKDYIATPKANDYQSLHTALVGYHGKILEVQIRTEEMHLVAEDGIAAHWRYKGTERDKKFDRKISWIKQILDWRQTSKDAQDFIDTLKIDLFEKEIIVFTPKGDPITLAEHSTPVDFAYEIHTNVGNFCSKALVNEKLVPLETELKPGDLVEIVTTKNAKPSRQWLKFVKTSKAKSKIRSTLNIVSDLDAKTRRERLKRDEGMSTNYVKRLKIDGKKVPIKLSKCCEPKPDDEILGFYTKDGKITVHKKDCPNLSTLDQKKKAKVSWIKTKIDNSISLKIVAQDRVGMIADILNTISRLKLNVEKLNTDVSKNGRFMINVRVNLINKNSLINLIKKLKAINEIVDVLEIKE
jgi:GTP diphosphokinase / guanosine-3',5'-bis(diphosphate) 3'-diphosphatase